MRRAAARTATRRGWVTRIRPGRSRWDWVSAAARAAGTSVVLPVPGGAVMTAQAPGRAARVIAGSEAATGRSGGSDTRSSSVRTPPLSPLRPEGAGAAMGVAGVCGRWVRPDIVAAWLRWNGTGPVARAPVGYSRRTAAPKRRGGCGRRAWPPERTRAQGRVLRVSRPRGCRRSR